MQAKWPNYEVAPDESVFALGVVSINYSRFELTHVWMLSAVANMVERQAWLVVARMNAGDRVKLIQTFFEQRDWPHDTATAIKHYLKAMTVLIQSRNILIHSNMARGTDNRTSIFSLSKQGRHNLFHVSIDEIRAVADGLETYFKFGHMLSNYIATEIHAAARVAGMMAVSQLPDLPPLPIHIDPNQRTRS